MKVKTFEEACEKRGYSPETILPEVSLFPEEHQKALIATAKMYIISEVLNDGWKPNWGDYNEYKWRPWFYLNNPGFRFAYSSFDFVLLSSETASVARLCYKTKSLSDYSAKQFTDLWKDMMI